MERIFVYGSLREGMYNYDLYLKSENTFRRYAYVKGTLFTIQSKPYPALLLEGDDMIIGEIHEVSDQTLARVDEMEGYLADGSIDNDYHKMRCDIYDENQTIIDQLPVYVFNMDKQSNKESLGHIIEERDYVKYVLKQKEGN